MNFREKIRQRQIFESLTKHYEKGPRNPHNVNTLLVNMMRSHYIFSMNWQSFDKKIRLKSNSRTLPEVLKQF